QEYPSVASEAFISSSFDSYIPAALVIKATVFVQIEAPKPGFEGRVAEGCYILEGGVLTLTNRRGDPVRDTEGQSYTQKLEPGDNAKQIAGLLTKKFRKPAGFSGPITYPKTGRI